LSVPFSLTIRLSVAGRSRRGPAGAPRSVLAAVVASSTLLVGIGAGVGGPADGTPRADFCVAVDHVWLFASLTAVAVGSVTWTGRARRPATVVAVVASVAASALVVFVLLAFELEANVPNPVPL
jgi:hypothetical protein